MKKGRQRCETSSLSSFDLLQTKNFDKYYLVKKRESFIMVFTFLFLKKYSIMKMVEEKNEKGKEKSKTFLFLKKE
jgi:hypothetical protein